MVVYKNVREFLNGLFRNILPLAYKSLEGLDDKKVKIESSVGYKQFLCMNIVINITSMFHAINALLFRNLG